MPPPFGSSATSTPSRQHTILIVDDDLGTREGLQVLLSAEGFRARAASTVAEALGCLASDVIDLMLLDLRLDADDGLDILRELPSHSVAPRTVVMTGFASVASVAEAMRLGAADFVEKPVVGDELFELVLRNLERSAKGGRPQPSSDPEPDLACFVTQATEFRVRLAERESGSTFDRRGTKSLIKRPRDPRLREFISLMDGGGRDVVRRSAAAWGQHFGTDAAHFGRLLHRQTGLKFRTWQMSARLRSAPASLAFGAEPIRAIAFRLGYTEPTQFSREFKHLFGMTPGDYRRRFSS